MFWIFANAIWYIDAVQTNDKNILPSEIIRAISQLKIYAHKEQGRIQIINLRRPPRGLRLLRSLKPSDDLVFCHIERVLRTFLVIKNRFEDFLHFGHTFMEAKMRTAAAIDAAKICTNPARKNKVFRSSMKLWMKRNRENFNLKYLGLALRTIQRRLKISWDPGAKWLHVALFATISIDKLKENHQIWQMPSNLPRGGDCSTPR